MKRIRSALKRAWTKVKEVAKKIFTKRNVVQVVRSVSTLAVTGYVMAYFLPLWLAGIITSVVVAHEFGHFFTAVKEKRQVNWPYFIPMFWTIGGFTRVKGMGQGIYPESDMKILSAGSIVGSIVAVAIAVVSLGLGFYPGVYVASAQLLFQLYAGLFGSDGRKLREARKYAAIEDEAFGPVQEFIPSMAG